MNTALEPALWLKIIATLSLLAVILSSGWLLLPRCLARGSKLLRLALIGASGLLFLSGVSGTLILHHVTYMTLIPVLQIACALWWRRGAATDTSSTARDAWGKSDLLALASVSALTAALFHLPLQRSLPGGNLREVHEDIGFFAQQVIALPEAGVASQWTPVLGPDAAEAGVTRDLWYHWGPIYIATALRSITGMPSLVALLDVTSSVLGILLVLAAAAVAGRFVRGSVLALLLLGLASVTATQVMKNAAMLQWMAAHLPHGHFQHSKVSLALYFAYKFEAIVALGALAAWLHRLGAPALLLLFAGCVSAPHTVAACGVTGAALATLGLVLRRPAMWRPGLAMISAAALAWALTLLVFRAEMAGGSLARHLDASALGRILAGGLADTAISIALSAISLPGLFHLMRARDAAGEPDAQARALAWMALGGIAASCIAFHLLGAVSDSFHVMLFVQFILVTPLGIWGLARMWQTGPGPTRALAAALVTASVLMGLHDLILPRVQRTATDWSQGDLAAVRSVLQGRPLGYFAQEDRGWWISKRGVMASMVDSRVVRLNPLRQESKMTASRFYGYTRPFDLVPPVKGENATLWALRFAQKLGVRHVLSTREQPLPKSVADQSRLVFAARGIQVFELPASTPAAGAARTSAQDHHGAHHGISLIGDR